MSDSKSTKLDMNMNWTRIYATPSNILRSSGSVGVALIMWLVGALVAACGTAVYIELGTVCFLAKPIFLEKFRPYLHFLSRDFLGVEARKIISSIFTVVQSSWRRVPLSRIPS